MEIEHEMTINDPTQQQEQQHRAYIFSRPRANNDVSFAVSESFFTQQRVIVSWEIWTGDDKCVCGHQMGHQYHREWKKTLK